MSPMMSGLAMLAALFALLAVGTPIAFALGLVAMGALFSVYGAFFLETVGEQFFGYFASFSLVSVPMFILMGAAVASSPAGRDLYEALDRWLNRVPGGLVLSNLGACSIFAALSGSSPATCAAIGKMGIPEMRKRGYPSEIAAGSIAAGGTLGILIPPSIAYIVIGLVLGISASTLFEAALIPGLLILLSILVTNSVVNRMKAFENNEAISFAEWGANVAASLKRGWYAFLVPGIIFYGIFSGRLTPTEAGAVAVVVTIVMGFVLRTLRFADFPSMLVSSAKVNGVILPIIAFSLPLAQALAALNVPQGFVYSITEITSEPVFIIALMIVVLIAAGCVMETTPNIVILAPILKPLADEIGMGELQFCVMMITALGVGFIPPPLGLNLFVTAGLTGEPILKIAYWAIPFVLFMLMVVLLIAYVPVLSVPIF